MSKKTILDAYKLLHDGTDAFVRAEQQGFRIDVEYCERKKKHLTRKINRLETKFKESKFYKHWEHVSKGTPNIDSNWQLSHILYDVKKIKPPKTTASGKGSTDVESLTILSQDIPELKMLLDMRKLKKVRDTYLDAFLREQVKGYIHPFYNLNTVVTYRSCVAKGTKILVCRDFQDNSNGVPIEEVKKGDYVYCFDNDLKPAIRKVLWAGKTGHREVVRVHYSVRGGGGGGFVDVTPEHKIRLINGQYEQAQNLLETDFRAKTEKSRYLPKVRALSCKRSGDSLRFTNNLKYGNGIKEYHLIYEYFHDMKLQEGEIIHHKNGDHYDHRLENLEKTNLSCHSSYHALNRPFETTEKCIQALKDNRHKIQYKNGEEHHASLNLSKMDCLRELIRIKGQVSKTKYDFDTFKKYLAFYGVCPKEIKLRYDRNGVYISRQRLRKLSELGRAEVSKILGLGYAKVLALYKAYGIPTDRKWANQFGEFKPGNHMITKVEWIGKKTDVYDIEVEEFHNFFANEICVHNSSDSPNFQNIPSRDKEAMRTCRRAIFPRPGHQLMEVDYSGVEVRVSACYHKDPNMIKYIKDPHSDMHGDMAAQIFLINDFDRKIPEHKQLRSAAKNGFVFPQFYGDYYKNCAENLACRWAGLPKKKWKTGQGIAMPGNTFLSDHLISQGIKSYNAFEKHVQNVEDDFWGWRFKVYQEWKEELWEFYQKNGYVDMFTGFRCTDIMKKNECINTPIQGSAFHCLLWSFIELDRIMQEEKWDTKLVGQIHDAILLDVAPHELDYVAKVVKRVTCHDLPKAWDWIIVPLDVEADLCDVDECWANKKEYKLPD